MTPTFATTASTLLRGLAARLNQLGWCRPDGVRWTQRTVSQHSLGPPSSSRDSR